MEYPDPPWSKAPPSEDVWKLIEIKGGVEVSNHVLDKACTTLGKAGDIETLHPSCSRLHARIAFDGAAVVLSASGGDDDDSTGTSAKTNICLPWLRDLQSTHGTRVNKQPLPAASVGRMESNSKTPGSRGVLLFPGDIIQLGASTRIFCVEGPAHCERGAVRAAQAQQRQANRQSSSKGKEEKELSSANDASQSSVEAVKPISLDDPSTIPPQHQKLWQNWHSKKLKLQNIMLESERIQDKQHSQQTLTKGQESQLERNQKRQATLHQEMLILERELMSHLGPNVSTSSDSLVSPLFAAAQEEDEVEDRTVVTKSFIPQSSSGPETEASLVVKWKKIHKEHRQCSAVVEQHQAKVDALELQLAKIVGDNAADEDVFYLKNDIDLAKDNLARAEQKQRDVVANLNDTEKLLHIVNPKCQTDRDRGLIGEELPPLETSNIKDSTTDDIDHTSQQSQKAAKQDNQQEVTPANEEMTESTAMSMMPPPPAKKKLKTQASSMPPPVSASWGGEQRVLPLGVSGPLLPTTTTATNNSMPPPPAAHSMPSPPTRPRKRTVAGTLSFLQKATMGKQQQQQQDDSAMTQSETTLSFSGQHDSWKAPEEQDGSGITKLNAKFGGRY